MKLINTYRAGSWLSWGGVGSCTDVFYRLLSPVSERFSARHLSAIHSLAALAATPMQSQIGKGELEERESSHSHVARTTNRHASGIFLTLTFEITLNYLAARENFHSLI